MPGAANEMVTCGPVWCRVLVIGPGGQPARTDVMRPTGADRMRMAAGNTTSAVLDVALLDRFEVLAQTTAATGRRSADGDPVRRPGDRVGGAGHAASRRCRPAARCVWWSTGSDEAVEWFALDLRTLN